MQDIMIDRRIAIIGMAGRFPGARTVDELWQVLTASGESRRELTEADIINAGVSESLAVSSNYVRSCMYLQDIDSFDAGFFGYSPKQAADIDPQHRIFLECAWEALEHAGYSASADLGSVGVFGGVGAPLYLVDHLNGTGGAVEALLDADKDFLCARVSYKLGLTGPSLGVQTACSSSLVAVHLASQNLLTHECNLALAGGVSIDIRQGSGYPYLREGIASPDGRCRAFDKDANGTAQGSGVGVAVLKRYADALADGDTIHAVILGSAVNNDGAAKVGFTAPSVQAQTQLILTALSRAKLRPQAISYIEGHGTGTAVGDAIELTALRQVFSANGEQQPGSCAVGSLKTNIGHLGAAAGIAGLIKTVLCLEHQTLVPTVHFHAPNSVIDFRDCPLRVSTELRRWEVPPGQLRRAGVTSLGLGGTNAHVVLEEHPSVRHKDTHERPELFVFSAASSVARAAMLRHFAAHVGRLSDPPLSDIAFTTQVGRKTFKYRAFAVAREASELVQMLDTVHAVVPAVTLSAQLRMGEAGLGDRTMTWVFPGVSGARLPDMSFLYSEEPSFRDDFARCIALLGEHCQVDLKPTFAGGIDSGLALFAFEWSLARLLMLWGLRPSALIGEGVGEYVCACLAGVLSLEEGVRLLAARNRCLHRVAGDRESALSEFKGVAAALDYHRPDVPIVSGLSAAPDHTGDPEYWALHVQSPVTLSEQLKQMAGDTRALLVELGVGDSLLASHSRCPPDQCDAGVLSFAAAVTGPQWDRRSLLSAVGTIWLRGATIEPRGSTGALRGRRIPLPTYPFQGQRYWLPRATTPAPACAVGRQDSSETVAMGNQPAALGRANLDHEIAAMWSEVLGVKKVEAHDSFVELGGDSMCALRLVARIEEVAGVMVSLEIFTDPDLTIGKLVDSVMSQTGAFKRIA
jgi:acyl transferase domain-containing protein